jgi:acyl-CoA thioester hydrolase
MIVRETEVRVRYQETDNMGVVYYANYFVWLEIARTEYLRSFGISYRELERKGLYLMVASASCDYKAPARYDDIVRIETWIPAKNNTSIEFAHKMFLSDSDRLLATARSAHVFTNRSGKPVRIPGEIALLP